MFQIILIKPNDFNLDDIPYKSTPNKVYENISRSDFLQIKSNYVDIPKMKEKIASYIEIISVDKDNFMEKSVEKINLDDKHYGDVRDCYEEPNNIYQAMFRLISQYDDRKKLKNNVLASMITNEKELIYGNVILFKTNLPKENYEMLNVDIIEDDIINLIMNNMYHTGVYIDNDNTIQQIFFNNSLEIVDPTYKFNKRNDINQIMKNENYGQKNNEILKYNIQFIFDMNSRDNINEPLSRIICAPIRGKGIMISPCDNENSFYDLSRYEILDLLKISPNYDLSIEESSNKKNDNGYKIIKNKYRIVNSRLNTL
jgi:hypothetical protein